MTNLGSQTFQTSLFPSDSSPKLRSISGMVANSYGQMNTAESQEKAQQADVSSRLYRTSDPITSVVAGEKTKEFRARHISKIWAVLKDFGPMNKNEIASKTGLDATQVARRGKEMELNHLVKIGPERKDGCRLWRALT